MNDLDFLVESRLDFIYISSADENYELIKKNLYLYFEKSLEEKQCDIVLAEFNFLVIGTGNVFYYDSVPSLFNPWGKTLILQACL